jgi:hypothetical protein
MMTFFAFVLLATSFHTVPDTLVGRYALDPGAGDDPAAVAEQVTRDVGRLRRGPMRDRLKEVLTPSPTLEIRREDHSFVITGAEGRSLRVVPGGPEVTQETPEGEAARIAASLDGESLTIRIRTARGERVQTLTPTDSGLRMVNTYTVEQLSEPMRIELVYRRDGA